MSAWGMRVMVVALVAVPTLAGCAGSPGASTVGPTAAGAADPSANVVVEDIGTLGATTISAKPFPDWLIAEPNGVWVANVDDGLVRLDLETGATNAAAAIGDVPLAIEIAGGAVWAASSQPSPEVIRVPLEDPAAVVRIPLPLGPRIESSITSDDALVWLLVGAPLTLIGIDQATGEIVRSFEVTAGLQALRFAGGALWASSPTTAELVRLDRDTGAETLRVDVGPQPAFMASGAGSLWVMNQGDGSVSRVDPGNGEVVATIVASTGPIEGGDIVATDDAVWVRTSEELAVEIDPETDTVIARLGPPEGSGSIAVGGGAVWVSAHDVLSVHRIPQSSISDG